MNHAYETNIQGMMPSILSYTPPSV